MLELPGRWRDLETILNRSSNLAGPNFEPGEHLLDFLQVAMQDMFEQYNAKPCSC
jgi:hypothetical protein